VKIEKKKKKKNVIDQFFDILISKKQNYETIFTDSRYTVHIANALRCGTLTMENTYLGNGTYTHI
jgi:hypothetical protein